MGFDFSNNIQLNEQIDIFDNVNIVNICDNILYPFGMKAELSGKRTLCICPLMLDENINIHNQMMFITFISLYDRLSCIFPFYKWYTLPAFQMNLQNAYTTVVTDYLLTDDNLSISRDLIMKYFHYTPEGDMIKIKYDIPMILSYMAFINMQLDEFGTCNKYFIDLHRNISGLKPDIISKDELLQFLVNVCSKITLFYNLRMGITMQQMIISAVEHHFGIPLHTPKTSKVVNICGEIMVELIQHRLLPANTNNWILPIFYDPLLKM